MSNIHKSHSDVVKRLRRAMGQLNSIAAMIEQERPCPDVAQQLHAVEKAVAQAKKAFIHDHIDHCLDHSTGNSPRETQRVVKEFRLISKYL